MEIAIIGAAGFNRHIRKEKSEICVVTLQQIEKSQVTGSVVSGPGTAESNAATGYLPQDADQGLREGLRQLFPALGDRPWSYRRMCWYTDTPKGDFIVDWHPRLEGLFVAGGEAGHAFKFLPVLGKYVADCVEGKAEAALREKRRLSVPEGREQGRSIWLGMGAEVALR